MEIKHDKYVWWSNDNTPEKISGKIEGIIPNMDKNRQQKRSKDGVLLWYLVLNPCMLPYEEVWIQINENQRSGYYQYHVDEEGTFIHKGNKLLFKRGVFEDTLVDPIDALLSDEDVCKIVGLPVQDNFDDFLERDDVTYPSIGLCVEWLDQEIETTKERLGILMRLRREI